MTEEPREGRRSSVMSDQFDRNYRRSEDGSFSKKMTRRPTKIVEGTILNRHKNVAVIV